MPDVEFLTQNTRDLEFMLKALPLEAFNVGKEEFEKDFEDIMNAKSDEDGLEPCQKYYCDKCKYTAKSRRVMRTHKQFVHDTNFYICNKCQGRTKTVGAMKIHRWNAHKVTVSHKEFNKHKEREENVTKVKEVIETGESDTDVSDSEYDDVESDLYQVKEWNVGCNFKARTPIFQKAGINLRSVFRKNAKEKAVNDLKIKVMDVTKVEGGKLAIVSVTDQEGTGKVQLHTWGPNKKTREMTVQIDKSSQGDVRFVEIFATKVVRPLLERLLKGETVKVINKSFLKDVEKKARKVEEDNYMCPVCQKIFMSEKSMKAHVARAHKTPATKLDELIHKNTCNTEGNSTDSESDKLF